MSKKKFNIIKDLLSNRPASWSFFSGWEWSKEEWYDKYILNKKQVETAEMIFGKKFAQSIEDGTCEVKELMDKIPYTKEYPFVVMFGNIPLIGYADDFDEETCKVLNEVKTGVKPWDQRRVDTHGQLTIYALMNFIKNKVKPEDVDFNLHWIPTTRKESGDFSVDIQFEQPVRVVSFKTKRTMRDILTFGSYISRCLIDMEEYVNKHD